MDLLADPEVGIVSLGGPAGTGKSVLALAAGLEAVLERATHRKVTVFRPLLRVGRHDGIASIVEDLAGHPLFAHVTLTRSERSPVAELVGRLLEGRPPRRALIARRRGRGPLRRAVRGGTHRQ